MKMNKKESLIKVYVILDDKNNELDTFRSTDCTVYLMRGDIAQNILSLKKGESTKVIGINQQHYTIVCAGIVEA